MPLLPFDSPCNPGSFMLEFQELQNYSPPRDRHIYLMYFLAKLWLSCDIQCLTPLTFNSNSVSSCRAGAWSCVSPEQECALSGMDLILFVKPCHWATMEMHASSWIRNVPTKWGESSRMNTVKRLAASVCSCVLVCVWYCCVGDHDMPWQQYNKTWLYLDFSFLCHNLHQDMDPQCITGCIQICPNK